MRHHLRMERLPYVEAAYGIEKQAWRVSSCRFFAGLMYFYGMEAANCNSA